MRNTDLSFCILACCTLQQLLVLYYSNCLFYTTAMLLSLLMVAVKNYQGLQHPLQLNATNASLCNLNGQFKVKRSKLENSVASSFPWNRQSKRSKQGMKKYVKGKETVCINSDMVFLHIWPRREETKTG